MKKKKLYPSQIKYRENNPTVSFVLRKDNKKKLDAIVQATGTSLSEWVQCFVRDQMDPGEVNSHLVALMAVQNEQFAELQNEERFTILCSRCGKPLYFSSNDSNWTSEEYPILKKAFGNWRHATCKSS